MIRENKAQMPTQIFGYLLAVIISGLILSFGFSAIKGFVQKGEQIEFVQMKKTLEKEITLMETRFGSRKTIVISVPRKTSEVCFVGQGASKDSIPPDYAIVAASVGSGSNDNVFLFPGGESWNTGNIIVDTTSQFQCFNTASGKARLRLEGMGNRVKISEP